MDDVRERLHRLLERRRVVVPVGLVEVDVLRLQPGERAVDRLHDVLAAQAPVVAARPGRPEHLGEDLEALTALPREGASEDGLGAGAGVDIGGVVRGDAQIERLEDTRGGGVVVYLGSVGDPYSVGYRTD